MEACQMCLGAGVTCIIECSIAGGGVAQRGAIQFVTIIDGSAVIHCGNLRIFDSPA